MASTSNFKRKYEAAGLPIVRIEAQQRGRVVACEVLQARGLVAEREPIKAPAMALPPTRRACGKWPSYRYCVDRTPMAQGEKSPT